MACRVAASSPVASSKTLLCRPLGRACVDERLIVWCRRPLPGQTLLAPDDLLELGVDTRDRVIDLADPCLEPRDRSLAGQLSGAGPDELGVGLLEPADEWPDPVAPVEPDGDRCGPIAPERDRIERAGDEFGRDRETIDRPERRPQRRAGPGPRARRIEGGIEDVGSEQAPVGHHPGIEDASRFEGGLEASLVARRQARDEVNEGVERRPVAPGPRGRPGRG